MSKKAFITGGSHGIGKGIAKVLAENGYDIAVTYNKREDGAVELRDFAEKLGRKCFYYQASFELVGVAEKVTQKAIEDLGGIDVLVCNAGYTIFTNILDLSDKDMDYMYNLNYRSYMMCSKVAANYMKDNKIKGNIVFITSTRGIRAYEDDVVYGGLKAALNRGAESMAIELSKYNIRVNCVAPGGTAVVDNPTTYDLTERWGWEYKIPLKRLGTPNEVGHLVKYIVSDEASYMTGNIIKLDGGLSLPGIKEEKD